MQKESGLSFLSRVGTRSESVHELGKEILESPLLPPEIIEISGDAGVGKSFLCLELMATALLPKNIFNIPLGGLNTSVIFIDSDQHFSILHFVDLMERKIKRVCHSVRSEWKKLGHKKDEELMKINKQKFNSTIDSTIKESLKNLFYFNCTESNQFYVTILSLEQTLRTKPNVSVVFIDSISSFYWYDRIYKVDNWHKMESYQNNIFHTFINIIKRNHLVCICTKQNLFKKKKDKEDMTNINKSLPIENLKSDDLVAYEFLGKEWTTGVSIRVNMSLSDPSKQDKICMIETIRGDESNISYCTFHEDGIRWANNISGNMKTFSESQSYNVKG